jgi:membrane protease YdiL (CAAX protease family)
METSAKQRLASAAEAISIQRIALFYGVAIVVSNLFRFDLFELNARLGEWSGLGYVIIRNVLEGSGVFLGALVAHYLLKQARPLNITFWGTSRKFVLLIAVVPLVLISAIGLRYNYGVNEHLFGAVATIAVLIYCAMEEYGWRGYLQQELNGLQQLTKYLVIGLLWYLWHLPFLENPSVLANVLFLGTLVLGSWGIGQVAVLTRSIGASACVHFVVNITFFNVFFHQALDPLMLGLVIAVCIGAWVIILRKWKAQGVEP